MKKEVSRIIGSMVREARIEHRLNQRELAEMIDIHQSNLSSLERGVRIPSTILLFKITTILGLSLDKLSTEVAKVLRN